MSPARLYPLVILTAFVLGGCAPAGPQQQPMKYPHKPSDDSSRISGPVMLLYEAAENEADPNNVIVIPPDEEPQRNED